MNYDHLVKQTPIKKGVEKLQAELAQAWKDIESLPPIELMVRNPQLKEYSEHWTGRAIKAESRVEQLESTLRVALEAFETDDWHKKMNASKQIREVLHD